MIISTVTIHRDNFEGLHATFVSLANILPSPEVQWIVVDGKSRVCDSRQREILEEVRNQAGFFSSEPDEGIYDAMNKGTVQASGDYVLYLNAGDELHPGFSLPALERSLGGSRPEMIWGVCHERYANGAVVRVANRSPRLSWYGMPVNHQNVLFRRDVLGNSPYDRRYRVCADYDLVSRILTQGGTVHRANVPIAIFQRGGVNFQHLTCNFEEEHLLRCRHYGVPKPVSKLLKGMKMMTARAGQVPALRRLLRKWV